MALQFEKELKITIASAIRDVPNVGQMISDAQRMYDNGNSRGAGETLEKAAELLVSEGREWASKSVRYYLPYL